MPIEWYSYNLFATTNKDPNSQETPLLKRDKTQHGGLFFNSYGLVGFYNQSIN